MYILTCERGCVTNYLQISCLETIVHFLIKIMSQVVLIHIVV